jgi:hypothetical protein
MRGAALDEPAALRGSQDTPPPWQGAARPSQSPPSLPSQTGADAIVEALRREHARHRHVSYQPVAAAANAEDRAAFVAVAWEYAPHEGGGVRWGRPRGGARGGAAGAGAWGRGPGGPAQAVQARRHDIIQQ